MPTIRSGEIPRPLERRGVVVERSGDELKMDCPVCGDTRKRLFFNVVKFKGYCQHECGGFSTRRFFKTFGLVDLDVAELLELSLGADTAVKEKTPGTAFPISSAVFAWYHTDGRAYLEKRGVTHDQARRHMLTYVPTCVRHKDAYDLTCTSCYCRQRVVIPIIKVGFIARDVTGESFLKDKTLPGSKVRTTLYGIERFRGRRAVLVEGVWDYYALEGELPALATFGCALSETQLQILLAAGVDEVVFLWDGDKPGRDAAERAAERIKERVRVRIAELPDGKDPDELPIPHVKAIVARALPYGGLQQQLTRAGLLARRRRRGAR